MNRRTFITSSACFAATTLGASGSLSQTVTRQTQSISLRVDLARPTAKVTPDFIGLGYEISSIGRLGLLSPQNSRYVQHVRTLGKKGVIRVGGNTSDYAEYAKQGKPVSSPQGTVVNETAIRDLAGFLESTGWQLIWGLNLGSGTSQNAIEEAAAVAGLAKDKLLAIEIGNEPDLFGGVHRARGYGYSDYLQEYRRWKAALRKAIPNISLAGPDVAVHTDWLAQFAADEGSDAKLLTHHYYAEGPPQNPASTMEKLLQTDEKLTRILEQCESASRQSKVPYRICETNSCFGGGKPGVSDTFAAALWGLDYLFTLATANSAGVNLETGVNQLGFVSSYSPIGDDEHGNYLAKPLYYAMLAFSQASRGTMVAVEYDRAGMNLKAYAVKDVLDRLFITMINKEPSKDVLLSVEVPRKSGRGSLMRMIAPSVDSKSGVTLGGSMVSASGEWVPAREERIQMGQGVFRVYVQAASAAILTLER